MNVHQILRLLRPLLYRRGTHQKWALAVVVIVIAWTQLQPYFAKHPSSAFGDTLPILSAFEQQRSDVIVESQGLVIKHLRDDNEGSRHQKMLLQLPGTNHTVLLAHNIDLAPRVHVNEGDTIRFRGEYEYSDKGGVIHWTHHDPQGRREGGWIEFDGKKYQ